MSKKELNLYPLEDRVVVEPLAAEEMTAGGLLLPDSAKETPQRGIVLAVGASPVVPTSVPGIDGKNVAWAPEAETDRFDAGGTAVIVGAGSIGVEVALDLHRAGKRVTLIDALDEAAANAQLHRAVATSASEFRRIFAEEGIPVEYNTALVEVRPDGVLVRSTVTGEERFLPCDSVLLAAGMRARIDTVEALRRSAPETSVHIIGDCRSAATVSEAVNGAFQACLHI